MTRISGVDYRKLAKVQKFYCEGDGRYTSRLGRPSTISHGEYAYHCVEIDYSAPTGQTFNPACSASVR